MQGNVVDMAVGIVIGAAFGKIVSSFVSDIVMPPIGAMVGGVDFSKLSYEIQAAAGDAEAVAINYGSFLQTLFDFIIVAFAIFMVIKAMNSAKKEEEDAPDEPSKEEVLLTEIRDALKRG